MQKRRPFFSIIVPTYDRPRRLRSCLQSMTGLTYPRERFEVIVVDDGSPNSIAPVVDSFRARMNVSLIEQSNAGPGVARNKGASNARGELLVFTDDDCTAGPGWLEALADRFAESPGEIMGGGIVNALPGNPFSTTSQQLVEYLYDYYNAPGKKARFFTSSNLAVPAERFREIGGFNNSFPLAAGEDRELCDRWLHHGFPMSYQPAAIVHHAHSMSIVGFLRQHFGYGRGAFHFHRARVQRSSGRIEVEPLGFYLGLLRYPLFRGDGPRGWLHMALMVTTQTANACGFFLEASLERLSTASRKRSITHHS